MKIAIIIDSSLFDGGGFQTILSSAKILAKQSSPQYEFVFLTRFKSNLAIFKKHGISVETIAINRIDYLKNSFLENIRKIKSVRWFEKACRSKFTKWCENNQIDLAYFLGPSDIALLCRCNYILTVWDLCHRDFPEFPEVRSEGEFERRERTLTKTLPMAFRIFADSEEGKKNIVRRYAVDDQRVMVLPFLPSLSMDFNIKQELLDIKKKYKVQGDYIFYPAQFWPHKNHVYILKGLKAMKVTYGKIIYALFSGGDKGNLEFVKKCAIELGVADQIRFLGFVSESEIKPLYKSALALIMPTYFGPTNIPPLEAFMVGCPVLYSGIYQLEDQFPGAVLHLDLHNPKSMADQLMKIIAKNEEVTKAIKKGYDFIKSWNAEGYWNCIEEQLSTFQSILGTWKL